MTRWSDGLLSKKHQTRRGKYSAVRTERGGYSFASKGEASCFTMLKLLERAGELSNIQVQDHVYLTEAGILYVADFKVFDVKLQRDVWIEFKGAETATWRIKRRLWQKYGPGILRVYKRTGRKDAPIYLHEEIEGAK